MSSFIEQLSLRLMEGYGDRLGEICLVFPSRRACVFMEASIGRLSPKATWAPALFSIEDFVPKLLNVSILDPISLTFELWPIYHAAFPSETFDQYYSWGQLMVSDFGEVDEYLVDPGRLFQNLAALRRIDTTIDAWLNEDGQPTPHQQKFMQFWDSLGTFYTSLNAKLSAQGMASGGQALRRLARAWSEEKPLLPWKKVVFAGFNALSPAEEQLISSLRKWGIAECYWDLDEWYTERKQQEAGKFFRSLRKRWEADDPSLRGGWEWIGQALETGQKEMVVTAVPKRVGQAKAAGLLLAEMAEGVANESIALVLPDENLLFPVLHSLPATLQDVNVTMGYPLRNTPLYGLVDAVLTLHENAERLRPSGEGESVYYFRDIAAILRHPYIHQLATEEGRETMRQITQENMIYLAPGYFLRFGAGHILRFLFSPWGSVSDATQYLQDLFLKLKGAFEARQKTENPLPTVESEILFQFHSLTQKLKAKLAKYLDEKDLGTFRRIYREVIAGASLPFAGEPLKGIQVMGMLETRVLDFERLIILSANEGILPPKQSQDSMVPYGIRKAFGMPTYEDKDAVYAYHFYRLLQRASQVRILYDAVSDGLGGGEKSRFIAQIEVELMSRNPGIRLRQETFTFPSGPEAARPVTVWKDEAVLRKLVGLGQENGFSPSGLNSYLQCSLQFYFRQVLGLREKTLPEETMEDNTFGSVVHKIMERLYLPHVGQTLQPEDIRRLMEGIDATSEMVFAEKTHGQDHRTGHNRLLLGVVKDLVRQMLELDRLDAPIELIGLEQRLEALVPTTGHPGGLKIAGVVDRIDCVGGKTRIIDYKTGRVDSLAVRNFLELKDGAPKKEVFQLGSYAYLYAANHSPERPVYPGIFAMRNLSDGIKTLEYGPQKAPDFDLMSFSEFQGLLTNILDDILDPDLPFVQTSEVGRCLFCPYKVICNRG